MSSIRMIVGLGNPGQEYEQTRHNAGFWWLDNLGEEHGARFAMQPKHHGLAGVVRIGGQDVWLMKPQTFMNDSGLAVASMSRFYRIAPEEILVVHDDLDLLPGIIRLKQGGGHGGHNGLRSIISLLSSHDFWRLRIGIGHPGSREKVLGYVLGRPGSTDLKQIEMVISESLRFVPDFVSGKISSVMQIINRRSGKPSKEDINES
ncbi:MAG: aminoacyl-tRNA hydrolase [Pseudomonadota bacterium]|nr:aminoacyl-tRNA hydrolase [Pseudomonadota bacterium]